MRIAIVTLWVFISTTAFGQRVPVGKSSTVIVLNADNVITLFDLSPSELERKMYNAGARNWGSTYDALYNIVVRGDDNPVTLTRKSDYLKFFFPSRNEGLNALKNEIRDRYVLTDDNTHFYKIQRKTHCYIIAVNEQINTYNEYYCTLVCYKYSNSIKFP